MTTTTPRLFACNKVSFKEPFYGGDEIKIFASKSHSGRNRGKGAAIWIESANKKGFSVCVLEYGNGSSGTAEVNWIALQSVVGSEIGTTSLNSWTTGTQCRKIAFQKVRSPSILSLSRFIPNLQIRIFLYVTVKSCQIKIGRFLSYFIFQSSNLLIYYALLPTFIP